MESYLGKTNAWQMVFLQINKHTSRKQQQKPNTLPSNLVLIMKINLYIDIRKLKKAKIDKLCPLESE